MKILAIESSCDETAAAVIEDGRKILSSVVDTQIATHALYGGVVPEIASRRHMEAVVRVTEQALKDAEMDKHDVDAVAATCAPGLIGALLVGANFGKSLAFAMNKPFIPVHHIRGHIAATYLAYPELKPPFLTLIASGGHSEIVMVKSYTEFEILGGTRDDAAGEAFDKVARVLGVGYPGGPMIEKMAAVGNPDRFVLPRPLIGSGDCNLSFSGLKTAVRKIIESYSEDGSIEHAIMRKREAADICAAFQVAATDCLTRKLAKAIAYFKQNYPQGKDLVVSGGVAANTFLRGKLKELADKNGLEFSAPPIRFCTDNGVMIAWAGLERFAKGYVNDLDIKPRPRWPLDDKAPKAAGAGGVKA